jgi:hypothetical protein
MYILWKNIHYLYVFIIKKKIAQALQETCAWNIVYCLERHRHPGMPITRETAPGFGRSMQPILNYAKIVIIFTWL